MLALLALVRSSNLLTIAGLIVTAITTALVAYGLHTISSSWAESRHELELATQRSQLVASCEAQKKITQEVSSAYQQSVSDLNAQLAAVSRRLRQLNARVPATTSTAGRDGAAGAGQSPDKTGDDLDQIIKLTYDGEQYRRQLTACQDFIKRTWNQVGGQNDNAR